MSLYVGITLDTKKGPVQIGMDRYLQGVVRDIAVKFAEVQRGHNFNREPYPKLVIDSRYEVELFATMVKEEIKQISLDDEGYISIELARQSVGYDFHLEQLALGNAERDIQYNKISEPSKQALKKAFIKQYFNETLLYGYTINQIKRITLDFS